MTKSIDNMVNQLAASQHNVFTRPQVLALGATDGLIKHRLRGGRWVRMLSGIYCLPGANSYRRTLVKAATLAIPGAVASHQSAAELHEFSFVPTDPITVTTEPGANHRLALGVVHEYLGMIDADHTVVDGIPVTTPALTIFHLAAVLRPKHLERVIDDRLNARAVALEDLYALADFWARMGRRGSRLMRRLLSSRGPGYTAPESQLEAAFIDLIRRYGLPEPVRQFATPWDPAEGRLDFAYPDRKVLIEVDGRRWHGRDADFDKDRARDRKAQHAGWQILRFTWHEVTRLPDHVAADLRSFLALSDAA